LTVREQFIVGIDLGGTNIAAGAMPVDGTREIGLRMVPTHAEEGAGSVVDRIAALVEEIIAHTREETGQVGDTTAWHDGTRSYVTPPAN
jgi:predicted NBD/HSP70 family sugar kinase